MPVEKGMKPISFTAGADLSARQYRFVVPRGANVVASSAGGFCLGVLQNDPVSGAAAAVETKAGAVTPLTCGGSGIGAIFQPAGL